MTTLYDVTLKAKLAISDALSLDEDAQSKVRFLEGLQAYCEKKKMLIASHHNTPHVEIIVDETDNL